MRTHTNRDPLRYYEVVKILGDGSMGSVSKVQKRKNMVGGSARPSFVEAEYRRNLCFGFFFCPAICPVSKEESSKTSALETIDEKGMAVKTIMGKKQEKGFARSGSSMITYGKKYVTYALKSIHLDRVKDAIFKLELMNEVAILQRLDHPHIVKAIETFDYHERLYLVLELCSGGDLYSRDPYDELQACHIIKSVMDAVAYMHSKAITHRDLKFENIMFASLNTFAVKIIDFGLSKKYAGEEHLHDTVGTVYTMAPEVLKGDYDEKVDIWSVGVIAFMLLSSSLPFYGKTRPHVVRKILHGRYGFKGRRWSFVSQKAKDFVTQTLVQNPERRPSALKALKHIWLDRNLDGNKKISPALIDQVQASIQTFSGYGYLKKLALLVLGYKSSEEEIGILHEMFNKFDPSHDGEISIDDFRSVLTAEYDYTLDEIDTMFAAMDVDGTGKVHYSEFLAATIEYTGDISEERLAEAFDRLDSDDSGYITVQNLQDFLGEEVSEGYTDSIIDEADLTRDHRISYAEFLALWNEHDDEQNRAALRSVTKRRSTIDDDSIATSATSGDMEKSTLSADSTDLGGGNYFFDIEKEKTVRGVWV
jgi:calcium-dependent protein kinase